MRPELLVAALTEDEHRILCDALDTRVVALRKWGHDHRYQAPLLAAAAVERVAVTARAALNCRREIQDGEAARDARGRRVAGLLAEWDGGIDASFASDIIDAFLDPDAGMSALAEAQRIVDGDR